jgi:hypothetical protein
VLLSPNGSGTTEHCVIVLNDIYIDVMDYIIPASCTETEFRAMWAEFEWENKVGGWIPANGSRAKCVAMALDWVAPALLSGLNWGFGPTQSI